MEVTPEITITQEDNMELMSRYPDNYFDLAIVDPPYGIDAASDKRGNTKHGKAKAQSKSYGQKDWDKSKPGFEYYHQLFRVSKNQIIWGANHLGQMPESSCWIVWDKQNGDNGYADCELAYSSFKSAVRMVSIRWHGMLQHNMKEKEIRIHPTQKPVALYEWLFKNYAKQGDKILDSHLGSESIAIALNRMNQIEKMNLTLTACELDNDYY